jgi:hypothetical protein
MLDLMHSQHPNPAMQSDRVFCERRMLSQNISVSFADLPKMQTLTLLKSQKTEDLETSMYYSQNSSLLFG